MCGSSIQEDEMGIHRHSVSFAHEESPSKKVEEPLHDEEAERLADPLRCGVLFVGNASGKNLLADILLEGKSFMHYVQTSMSQSQSSHVTPGLVEVAGVSVVEYWNRGCSTAERISMQYDIFVATNSNSYEEYKSWSLGNQDAGETNFIPEKNIVLIDDDCTDNVMKTAAAFVEQKGWNQHLLIVDLEHVCSSEFSFQKFVEHATVRMKDCMTLVETASSTVNTVNTLEAYVNVEGIKENPRITRTADVEKDYFVDETSTIYGIGNAVMYVIKSSLPLLQQYAALDGSDQNSIVGFMKFLLDQGKNVYGLPMDVVVPVKSVEDLRYTTALFDHIQRAKFKQKSASKTQDTDSEIENIFMSNPQDYTVTEHKAKAKRAKLDVLLTKKDFDMRYAAMLKQREIGLISSYGSGGNVTRLPERFANVACRKHDPRIQHPVYQTTNNNYGLKPASQQQTTMKYYGIKGTFTNDFSSMMYKNTGFNTTRTTSKVHRQMDDF